jgi:hypothetical protein
VGFPYEEEENYRRHSYMITLERDEQQSNNWKITHRHVGVSASTGVPVPADAERAFF